MTDFLTGPEAAAAMDISYTTLLRWRDSGVGPPTIKIGRFQYYDRAVLESWLASDEARAPERREAGSAKHGTGRRYKVYGCRCADCRAWKARTQRRQQASRRDRGKQERP